MLISKIKIVNFIKSRAIYISLLFTTLFSIVALIIYRFEEVADLKEVVIIIISTVIAMPPLAYFIYILKKRNKRLGSTKIITVIFQMLLFYSGLFIAIEYLKPKLPQLYIPQIKEGAVGFKSWQAVVEISDIVIKYQDTNLRWIEIDTSIIRNPNNWLYPIKPPVGENVLCVPVKKPKHGFIIENCYIIFKPSSISSVYKNVRLDATVKFLDAYGDNPGVNFVTHADTSSYQYSFKQYEKNKTCFGIDDMCVEFAFPFNDYPHPWLPAFDRKPAILSGSTSEDVMRIKLNKKKKLYMQYHLSAIVFNNQLIFTAKLPNYGGTSNLFESKMEGATLE